ncbi:hypothetical protein DBR43_26150 [Pedobacter sp. KBW06]|uniref:hypothetical protein n=1 Tax=Pedobacter sp. KBW06 TaxID=2153359 RepID=UPI000F59468B|nr:hypothetical protein [Pedobacter sp. KBW06]RQO67991.1 hypothetical protein DBR43_26150 [Pedobacter sp. KBW06]
MKRNLIIVASCIAGLVYSTIGYAQNPGLAEDQNPRYQESRAKYIELADSLNRNQGSTVQNTYKAYDWYTAREERRALRRQRNYENSWYNPYYYGNSYYSPIGLSLGFGYSNYGWGNNYGYGNWGHHGRWNRW